METYFEITGTTLVWIIIEILVFVSFMGTLVILMMKSRCMNVGVDHSYQFEPIMMARIANRIIKNIKFTNRDRSMAKLTKKVNLVLIDGVIIKVKMTEEDFDEAYDGYIEGKKDIVSPEKADKWILDNVQGKISKEELDHTRYKTVNEMDMM